MAHYGAAGGHLYCGGHASGTGVSGDYGNDVQEGDAACFRGKLSDALHDRYKSGQFLYFADDQSGSGDRTAFCNRPEARYLIQSKRYKENGAQ